MGTRGAAVPGWRTVTRRSQQIALTLAADGRSPPNVCNVESAHGRAHTYRPRSPAPRPTGARPPSGPKHARQYTRVYIYIYTYT